MSSQRPPHHLHQGQQVPAISIPVLPEPTSHQQEMIQKHLKIARQDSAFSPSCCEGPIPEADYVKLSKRWGETYGF